MAISSLETDHWQRAFAEQLGQYVGVNQVIPVSSGTAALQLALLASGVKPDEEVLLPANTFAGTASAIVAVGAVPHFVDGTTSINAYKTRRHLETNTGPVINKRGRFNMKTGRKISAMIAVDLLGIPASWHELQKLCQEFGLTLIEDAAQAIGAHTNGRQCGSFGLVAIMSFNNNKLVTTGGGGAVLTNDEWIASEAHNLANTCRVDHPWLVSHDGVGFNFRMNSMSAAIGVSQLQKLPRTLEFKTKLFEKYKKVAPMLEVEWLGTPNHWLPTVLVDNKEQRDELLSELHQNGIKARAMFTPLHLQPYKQSPRQENLAQAEDLFNRAVCLPAGKGAI